ncbi:mannose-1-phosphate guanylyltransferase, partial [Candidatus Desantisbacteria bacterium]|nr:mannose-1-phosphate guanylyltransferase [Candidatus Desantisbacteria bacterium]
PCDKGQILLGDKNRIIKFKEKPGKFLSHFINAGVYILEPRILEYIPQGMYYDFGKDLFPIIIQSEKLYAYEITEPLIDIGTPEIYKNFERYKTNRLEG